MIRMQISVDEVESLRRAPLVCPRGSDVGGRSRSVAPHSRHARGIKPEPRAGLEERLEPKRVLLHAVPPVFVRRPWRLCFPETGRSGWT